MVRTHLKINDMNKLQLYRELRRHIRLAEKRSPVYSNNKAAKIVIWIFGLFTILYIISFGIIWALAANDSTTCTPYEILFGLSPFVLAVDFIARFVIQQTPTQLVKPYLLLPISRKTGIELFILSSMATPNNLVWLALTIPFCIMTTLFSEGFAASLGMIVAFQLLITINSQWYMLIRSLIHASMKWCLAPVAVYFVLFCPMFFGDTDQPFDLFASFGQGFAHWNILNYFCVALVLAVFFMINSKVQLKLTYDESAGKEKKSLKSVSELKLFNRYGDVGEYLKIEAKSIMRNKNVRTSFLTATAFITILSLIISFTDIYSDNFSKVFWIAYAFVLYSIQLIKIMCAEGNYIDCLMTRRENIMLLLRAKYYFYASTLLLPFVLMLPTVFAGKYSLLSMLAMLAFTAGPIMFMLMQMAVYNRQTMPLNTKLIGKGGIETNYVQLVVQLVALFAPGAIILTLNTFLNNDTTYSVLLVTGIAFICTSHLWIRNIYLRMMKRRYKNMESFRATR